MSISFGADIRHLAICLFSLRLCTIAANVGVKAFATPLVGDPLEDSLAAWKAGMRSAAHQPSLAVLVTFSIFGFWHLGFLMFWHHFFVPFFCRKIGILAVRGKHLILPRSTLCRGLTAPFISRQKTVLTRSGTSRPRSRTISPA